MGEGPIYVPAAGKEARLTYHGRVDRADIAEGPDGTYLKIVDYKTGTKIFNTAAVYEGIELQLPVYMEAAIGALKGRFGGKLEPGGMLYLPVDDPVIGSSAPVDLDTAKQKAYLPSGLIRSDAVSLFDKDLGAGVSSEVIPAGYTKTGSLTAASKVADKDGFDAIGSYAKEKVKELGSRILTGDISMKPLRFEKRSLCAGCEFKKVCGFDLRIPGCRERVSTISAKDAMEEIKELMKQGNGKDEVH